MSQSVRERVSDKGKQGSDSGPIKKKKTKTKFNMNTIVMYMKTMTMTLPHLVRQAVRQQQDLCVQRSPGQGKDTFIYAYWLPLTL